jgi:hypothetical protein
MSNYWARNLHFAEEGVTYIFPKTKGDHLRVFATPVDDADQYHFKTDGEGGKRFLVTEKPRSADAPKPTLQASDDGQLLPKKYYTDVVWAAVWDAFNKYEEALHVEGNEIEESLEDLGDAAVQAPAEVQNLRGELQDMMLLIQQQQANLNAEKEAMRRQKENKPDSRAYTQLLNSPVKKAAAMTQQQNRDMYQSYFDSLAQHVGAGHFDMIHIKHTLKAAKTATASQINKSQNFAELRENCLSQFNLTGCEAPLDAIGNFDKIGKIDGSTPLTQYIETYRATVDAFEEEDPAMKMPDKLAAWFLFAKAGIDTATTTAVMQNVDANGGMSMQAITSALSKLVTTDSFLDNRATSQKVLQYGAKGAAGTDKQKDYCHICERSGHSTAKCYSNKRTNPNGGKGKKGQDPSSSSTSRGASQHSTNKNAWKKGKGSH